MVNSQLFEPRPIYLQQLSYSGTIIELNNYYPLISSSIEPLFIEYVFIHIHFQYRKKIINSLP